MVPDWSSDSDVQVELHANTQQHYYSNSEFYEQTYGGVQSDRVPRSQTASIESSGSSFMYFKDDGTQYSPDSAEKSMLR